MLICTYKYTDKNGTRYIALTKNARVEFDSEERCNIFRDGYTWAAKESGQACLRNGKQICP